jgi:hypothetical protein
MKEEDRKRKGERGEKIVIFLLVGNKIMVLIFFLSSKLSKKKLQ